MNSATAALKHDMPENWPKNNTKTKLETPVCVQEHVREQKQELQFKSSCHLIQNTPKNSGDKLSVFLN